jgi:hypothetical protein
VNIQSATNGCPQQMGCTILIILLSSFRVMVFLLIKFFAEITYQWITVTHLLLQPPHFHPFVVPDPGMGVSR